MGRELTDGQWLPYKSIGLLGELPWTRWCLNSWAWRCSRFASSYLLFPRGDRVAGASATTDRTPFSERKDSAVTGRVPGPESRQKVGFRRKCKPRIRRRTLDI